MLNRAVGRVKLSEKERDFLAFEKVVEEARDRTETRILSYCVMPAEAVRRSVRRGGPFGSEVWVRQIARQLRLESTLRPPGRPRKYPEKAQE